MHKSQSHRSHFGGNSLGKTSSAGHSGSKVPSDALPCRCFSKLLCCSLGSELFPFPNREGNAAGSYCVQKRNSQCQRNRNHKEWCKGSLISYGLVSCISSRLWPFLFSSVTSPDHPSCFPSPPSINLGIYLGMSAKQSVSQVRDPAYSTVWKSKSSGCLQDAQRARSSLCTSADGAAHGPRRGQPATSPRDVGLRPSSPATEFCIRIVLP